MSVYVYSGLNGSGKSVKGRIEAASEKLALDQLQRDGVIPVSIQVGADDASGDSATGGGGISLGGRVPAAARTMFVRELATFLRADTPLMEALGVIHEEEAHPVLKRTLADVRARVQSGESFSKALSAHDKVFPALLVSMARVGETGGALADSLELMANWMETEDEVRSEIRGAMAYPLVILALGFVTIIVLLTFVLPRITVIFAGMESNLPAPTKMLMSSSAFMASYWWAVLIGAGVAVGGLRWAIGTPKGREVFDLISLRAPVFGDLTTKSAVGRLARAGSALLRTGVPLLETLRVVRGLVGNVIIAAEIDRAIEDVIKGQPLAKTLKTSPYFPPGAIHLLAVGERTGKLGDMFQRIADAFERQTRARIKVLLNLLSPLLIVALAVLVGFIAISILLPIFQMNKMMR